MKAVTSTITKLVFACPDCGSPEHSYDHFKKPTKFGPWYCDQCGASVIGEYLADGTIEIERHTKRMAQTLELLRLDVAELKPVHIVVKGMVFYQEGGAPVINVENKEYYYNQHTCPWNYLRLPIKEGDNTDPHGLFVHQETILMPKGYTNSINDVSQLSGIDAWKELFPSLREN